MVCRQPTLDQLKQGLRIEICSTCPYRTERIEGDGIRRACESNCPLFIHLPVLQARAEQLDPLLNRHERALLLWMREMIEADEVQHDGIHAPRAPNLLRRHRHRAAKILAQLINP